MARTPRSLFTPADGATVAPLATLFIEELDGLTFASLEDLLDYHASRDEAYAKAEQDAEMAYERHLETNDRYRWEHEQDELRAAFFGGYDYGTGGAEYYA